MERRADRPARAVVDPEDRRLARRFGYDDGSQPAEAAAAPLPLGDAAG